MSRRRTEGRSPIALFSFQDIITSVTGIMILVVVLLILEVINRKSFEVAASAPVMKMSTITDAQDEIASMQVEKEKLDNEVERRHEIIAELARLDPRQIKSDIKREEDKNEGLSERLEALRAKLEKQRRQAGKAEKAATQGDHELQRLKEQLARIKTENRVTFDFLRTDKMPILVQCSQEGIQVKILDSSPKIRSFPSSGSADHKGCLSSFGQWVRGINKDKNALVVLVKPSAAPYAVRVINMLYKEKFDVGYEPLEESKTAIFNDEDLP